MWRNRQINDILFWYSQSMALSRSAKLRWYRRLHRPSPIFTVFMYLKVHRTFEVNTKFRRCWRSHWEDRLDWSSFLCAISRQICRWITWGLWLPSPGVHKPLHIAHGCTLQYSTYLDLKNGCLECLSSECHVSCKAHIQSNHKFIAYWKNQDSFTYLPRLFEGISVYRPTIRLEFGFVGVEFVVWTGATFTPSDAILRRFVWMHKHRLVSCRVDALIYIAAAHYFRLSA